MSAPKAPCDQCGKPVGRPIAVGDKAFCKAKCRAFYFAARSRKAAAANKKLKCPFCEKGNQAKARRCEHCKKTLLWFEKSPILVALSWATRIWIAIVIGGLAYSVYTFRDFLPMVMSMLSGGPQALSTIGSLGNLSNPANIGNLGNMGDVASQDPDAMADKFKPDEPPGPGTWLVPMKTVPAMFFSEDPIKLVMPAAGQGMGGPPPDIGRLTRDLTAKVATGKLKVRPMTKAMLVEILERGPAFTHIKLEDGSEGYAASAQVVER